MIDFPELETLELPDLHLEFVSLDFEAVMFEMRVGSFNRAEEMVSESLETYFATGRLWATLI